MSDIHLLDLKYVALVKYWTSRYTIPGLSSFLMGGAFDSLEKKAQKTVSYIFQKWNLALFSPSRHLVGPVRQHHVVGRVEDGDGGALPRGHHQEAVFFFKKKPRNHFPTQSFIFFKNIFTPPRLRCRRCVFSSPPLFACRCRPIRTDLGRSPSSCRWHRTWGLTTHFIFHFFGNTSSVLSK